MFDEILTAFVQRLATVTKLRPQVILAPLNSQAPYDGKTGTHCFVGSPEPEKLSGAGRYGYKVRRAISVLCVTESLNDPGGRSEVAVGRHLRLELDVVNAAMDFLKPPFNLGAIQCMWVPGGSEMMRYVKLAPALNGSVLTFEITYAPILGHLDYDS